MEITAPDPLDAEMEAFGRLSRRDQILSAMADIFAASDDRTVLPIKEMFLDGMYIREIFIPKGAFCIGKIHRQNCVNVCSQGSIDIVTEDGFFNITAPFTGLSQPGVQKLGFALEDTIWTNVFRTDETDLEKIEDVIALTNAEMASLLDPERRYLKGKEFLCL
ncbi:MAG: hypothetical protein WKF61_01030 [Luteimonas sp.]